MNKENESKDAHKAVLAVNDMVCESCEKIIEKSLEKKHGVISVHASYSDSSVEVSFMPQKISQNQIIAAIKEAGYAAKVVPHKKEVGDYSKLKYVLFGLVAITFLSIAYMLTSSTIGKFNISIPQLDANTSAIIIFFVGLLTGFHCIGMCGGFVLSYTAKARKENPSNLNLMLHLQYALGKIVSYSVIGGIFGLIGSFLVFTPELRATVAILAGIFLIFFAIKMLNFFPILRKLSLPQGLFDRFKVGPLKSNKGNPLAVGLMNGLFIACGPLQAMYIIAATTGSFFIGATMLFAFAIGTLIPMLGFGVFASFMSHGFRNSIVKLSAVIVLIMGILMINNGLALTGNAISLNSITNAFNPAIQTGSGSQVGTSAIAQESTASFQKIEMDVLSSGWSPNSFVLKKGVPVKWVINAKELTGCNSAITVPQYGLNFNLKSGIQTIEFTPDKEGTVQWSCWMGMIQGNFIVRDDVFVDSAGKVVLDAKLQQEVKQQQASIPKKSGCGCGGGS